VGSPTIIAPRFRRSRVCARWSEPMHRHSSRRRQHEHDSWVLDIFFEISLASKQHCRHPGFHVRRPPPVQPVACVSPANGSRVHALEPSARRRDGRVRHSGAFEGDPPARAITLVRASAYSWYSTRKPTARGARRRAARSRARGRRIGRLEAQQRAREGMASCSLMRTDDTSPIPLTGF